MVRCSCAIIIIGMTRKACRIYRLEIKAIVALVATLTFNTLVDTDKRKPAKLVNLINIFYDPGIC